MANKPPDFEMVNLFRYLIEGVMLLNPWQKIKNKQTFSDPLLIPCIINVENEV